MVNFQLSIYENGITQLRIYVPRIQVTFMNAVSPPLLEVTRFCDHVLEIEDQDFIDFFWADPRDISMVHIFFEPNFVYIGNQPLITKIFYWKNNWPENRSQETGGSGESGWKGQDDWYNGSWKAADIFSKRHPGVPLAISFTFKALAGKDYQPTFRRTLKLRIQFNSKIVSLAKIKDVKIYTTTPCMPSRFSIGADLDWIDQENFTTSIWNGYFSIKGQPVTDMKVSCTFETPVPIFASPGLEPPSFDGTQVTVWIPGKKTFTFSIDDLKASGFILLPDFHVVVRGEDNSMSWAEAVSTTIARQIETCGSQPDTAEHPSLQGKTVYERLFELPEQEYSRVNGNFIGKQPMNFVLGCEGARAKCAVTTSGNFYTGTKFIKKVQGPDTPRLYWSKTFSKIGKMISVDGAPAGYNLTGTMQDRKLMDGYLPVLLTTWGLPGGVEVMQEAFATLVNGIQAGVLPEGDADVVILEKLVLSNISDDDHVVDLVIYFCERDTIDDLAVPEPMLARLAVANLDGQDGYAVSFWKKNAPEYTFIVDAGADIMPVTEGANDMPSIELSLQIPAGESKELRFKYPLLATPEEIVRDQLARLDYGEQKDRVIEYWKDRIAGSASIDVPNDEFSAFYKAHVYHVLVTNDREIGSDLVFGRVGSFAYGTFTNEVCMIAMDLDKRGLYDEARRMLDVFVKYQGTQGLLGDYDDMNGVFFGANGYESGAGYNQNHGFVLWAMAEHARLSGDIEWYKQHADSTIKACDWISRERNAFQESLDARKFPAFKLQAEPYRGLLPAGGVEDIQDYWYWLSTNAYNSFGIAQAGNMLSIAGHPDAERVIKEASAYANAVKSAFEAGMALSPVVPLRDGTCVPHFPSRLPRRGRGFGWIQETLEGAIHLLRCWIISPYSKEATWILKDYEDNLYLSEHYGYQITGSDFDEKWFDFGGFSQQPFLLCNSWPYGIRGNTRHYLRSVFNAFAVNYRPDTKMFCEHPLPTMADVRGDFFKTSDEANFCSCLRDMIVQESVSRIDMAIAGWENDPIYHPDKDTMDSLPLLGKWDHVDGLRLLYHCPREWFSDGREIHARQLATYFGKCTLDMASSNELVDVKLSIDRGETWQNGMLLAAIFVKARVPDTLARIERAVIDVIEDSDAGLASTRVEPAFVENQAVGIDLGELVSPSWAQLQLRVRIFFRTPTDEELAVENGESRGVE